MSWFSTARPPQQTVLSRALNVHRENEDGSQEEEIHGSREVTFYFLLQMSWHRQFCAERNVFVPEV